MKDTVPAPRAGFTNEAAFARNASLGGKASLSRFPWAAEESWGMMPPSDQNGSPLVGDLVKIIGAIAGLAGAFAVYFQVIAPHFFCPPFCEAKTALTQGLQAKVPLDAPALRTLASNAYALAKSPDAKCDVVGLLFDVGTAGVVQATPMGVYLDYAKLPCQAKVWPLAKADLDAYVALKASNVERERRAIVERVVALGTTHDAIGWVYVGRRSAHGNYDQKFIAEADVALNKVVTLICDYGFVLQVEPPQSTEANTSPVVGFLPKGSRFQVLETHTIDEPLPGGNATYVYAKAKVMNIAFSALPPSRGPRHRRLARAIRAGAVMAAPAENCPPFKRETGSHGDRQRWVFVGRKGDSDSAAFLPQTSLLETDCIPRDGTVVRAKFDLKVLVGRDPHSPGVRPMGQTVAAGSQIQVVGDISGYPYDATQYPDFCKHDPPYPHPSKAYDPIPSGHQRAYCVYIPFNTV